jgi:hypothetical protein
MCLPRLGRPAGRTRTRPLVPPKVHDAFVKADSKGEFFNEEIRVQTTDAHVRAEYAPRPCVRRGDGEASWRHVFQPRRITHSRRQIRIPVCTRYWDQRNAVRVPPGPISPTLRRPLALASTNMALNRNPSGAVDDTRARSRSPFEPDLRARSRSRVCILSTRTLAELPEGKGWFLPCRCRQLDSSVSVVQSGDNWFGDDATPPRDEPADSRVIAQE